MALRSCYTSYATVPNDHQMWVFTSPLLLVYTSLPAYSFLPGEIQTDWDRVYGRDVDTASSVALTERRRGKESRLHMSSQEFFPSRQTKETGHLHTDRNTQSKSWIFSFFLLVAVYKNGL